MSSESSIGTATARGGRPRGLLKKASAYKTVTAQHSDPPKPRKVPESSKATGDSKPTFDFYANSVISKEEQQEIIVQINAIAEKKRRAFSAGAQADASGRGFKAKKHGGVFPVLVNFFAVAVLVGGFLALYLFQSEADVHAREGARALNPAERAIIDEIRRETNSLLAAADNEISILLALLADIEMQLQGLVADGEALTPEQLATQAMLMSQREELRATLEVARGERVRILSDARSQEMVVHAHFEARVRDEIFHNGLEAGGGENLFQGGIETNAREELLRLSGEQTQAAAVEAQVAGLLTHVYRQIAERSFDEVEGTLESLREFLGDPNFQSLRAIQARRDLYTQATAAIETLLEEYRATHEAMLAGIDRAAELRRQGEIAELQRELYEARNAPVPVAEDPGTLQTIAQLESTLTSLRSANATLSSQVNTLQGNLTAQTRTAEDLRRNIRVLQSENMSLNRTSTSHNETINELQSENENLRDALDTSRQTIERILLQGF